MNCNLKKVSLIFIKPVTTFSSPKWDIRDHNLFLFQELVDFDRSIGVSVLFGK